MIPITSADFDRAYRSPVTFWGDVRIPKEVKALIRPGVEQRSLELGCGIGRCSRYLAEHGVRATGVDFSPVAIGKAQRRVADLGSRQPRFLVGDVTNLGELRGPFDVSFDVGCFHCLDAAQRRGYAAELSRLLEPGGMHLIWALDSAPADYVLSPQRIREEFAPGFELRNAVASRRRIAASHWYWLQRRDLA